ncbi:hypothetical protein CWI75_02155 [Kineobactrum sediminis]|uniref:TolC family protein n=1 Tax=Kineobactrum sediminis TaxID=1905677 RepID=A0A2N5Y710_9GAMM|nr:TolC family protein [Kineobactrum sediminis]PLW84174.1 hypothetical protein CWI75_02155 [Kineobactrum sediminis]
MIHRIQSKGAQSIPGLCLAAFGLLALATSGIAATESGAGSGETALSLDRALAVARADNPLIAIDRARKARAEGARIRSRQGFSPRISLSATHLRLDTSLLDNPPGIASGFPALFGARGLGPAEGQVAGIQLVQPLVNVSAWNAHHQAGSALDAAELSLHRSRREVDVAVVEAYFGARTAGRQVAAEQKGLATALRALRQAEAGFEQELLAPVDVLSARTRVAEMEARVALADASVISAHAMLRRILGMDGDAQLVLTDPVPQPRVPEPEVVINQETLSNRRDLQALERGLEAAEFGVRRARAAWLPDINLYARYDRLYGNDPLEFDETGWLLAVHLRWTLFAGFSQIGALDEAQATEAETRVRLRALRQQAWAEAQTAHAEWTAEVLGWQSVSKGVLDAEQALALTEARYAEGLDDITALLRAQAEELAARTREINARFKALLAAERYRLALPADEGDAPP